MNNTTVIATHLSSLVENVEWQITDTELKQEINLTLHNLLKLSGHQYIWYGYQSEYDIVFRHSLDNIVYQLADPQLELATLNCEKSSILCDEKAKNLVKSIVLSTGIIPQSACLFKLDYHPDYAIYLVLFSEYEHGLDQAQACAVESYLGQQGRYLLLKNKNLELSSKLADLESSNEGRSKYFAMISHDLRAPFHGIMGCADILLHEAETLDADASHRLIQYIYDTSNSTYTLLEGLLNWSMARGGNFHLNRVHFRVNDVVQQVIDLLFASAYKKNISLHSDVELGLFAYADIHMVTSILQNLVSNALKFTPSNAKHKVTITSRTIDGYVQMVIEDNGIGMTAEQVDNLFVEKANPSTQGTAGEKGMGLGLVLCKQFISLNQGTMTIHSRLNKGTTFTIYLPLGNKFA